MRQGHSSEKCNFIISGTADDFQATQDNNGEVKRTLLNRLKRGDRFGGVGLINKIKRNRINGRLQRKLSRFNFFFTNLF